MRPDAQAERADSTQTERTTFDSFELAFSRRLVRRGRATVRWRAGYRYLALTQVRDDTWRACRDGCAVSADLSSHARDAARGHGLSLGATGSLDLGRGWRLDLDAAGSRVASRPATRAP